MPRIPRKFILIGVVSIVVIALLAVFTVPAMAAGRSWGPGAGIKSNITRVQGTIASLTSSQIQITTTSSNSSTNSVTLAIGTNTNFTIHGNGWLTSVSLVGDSVSAVYNNNQKVTPPVASQVIINMPNPPSSGPGGTGNHNFSTIQGTLSLGTSNDLIITPTNSTSIVLTALTNPVVNVLYNSTSGTIQRIMLSRTGQTTTTSANLPSGIAIIQGNLSVGTSNVLTISLTSTPTVPLVLPTDTTVTILYNSNSSNVIQSLMMGEPGQFGGARGRFGSGLRPLGPGGNFTTIQGTLSVGANDVLTITPATTPSVTLTVPTNATVNILYNSNDVIQRLVLTGSEQHPFMSNSNLTTIQGTLTVGAGDVLTITPTTTPVTLTQPTNATVTILYNSNSNDVIQGLMLGGAGQFSGGPGGMPMPNPNGMNHPGNSGFGWGSPRGM